MDADDLYAHGADAAREFMADTSAANLRTLFALRTARWKRPFQYVEGGTLGTFDDVTLTAESAYQVVGDAADLVLDQTDPDLVVTASYLLLRLIETTQTTQLPPRLEARWEAVVSKLRSPGVDPEGRSALGAIARWYRRRVADSGGSVAQYPNWSEQ